MSSAPKIISASRLAAKDLQKYVDKVVSALGHPGAFITDESVVNDLLSAGGEAHRISRGFYAALAAGNLPPPWEDLPGDPEIAKANAETLRLASEKLGIQVKQGDTIISLAYRVKNLARS